uniref:nucleolin n=1 Tax=Erigeron canadensis TaxID=72917 RepID=UPI001CB8AF19|nr:nucleolin [Erigeron canadensis]XP_043609198.1 nucleolin [Erigeron canadensis]XP_043609199.1 nucleolin [Erigeron canadensis]
MPPKNARKSAGPGRRGGRTRAAAKAAAPPQSDPVPEEPAPIEDVILEEKVEEKLVVDNGTDNKLKREDSDVKDSVEEYETGERLDLDDNDPEESEPEEYVGDEYDEREEVEDVQEEVLDVEEEVEDGEADEEEDGDIHEGEMEDATEELEPEEDEHELEHEHAADEPVEMADAEEQEHHDVFKERRKRKEFEIFVGGLDKDATEEDLRKVFSAVGEVSEVRLMMNAQTKKNKGFAFLRFATVEQAKRACVELKSPVVHGKQCGVSPSQDSDTLFLGNVCKTWTKEALKEKLKNYGIDTVEDLTLVEDNKTDGTNRGFAFLEFSSRSDAMDAFKRLQKRDVTFGIDRPAKVSFADSFIDPGDEIMAQVTTVFVDGLPSSWDEARVRELLKKYGNVEKIELARNMPSARRKDYGFITFGTHDAAVTCAKSINNEELGDGDNKAKVRARLSRPLQRGKGKHASRIDFRPGRPSPGGFRGPWARPVPRLIPRPVPRPVPRLLPPRSVRRVAGRPPPVVDRSLRRPVASRDRRPIVARPPRGRPVAPLPRSYDRRPPVPSHTKNSLKRDYSRREELPPRSRAVPDYGPPRSTSERSSSYRDNYPTRGPTYADLPRESSHSSSRRAYSDSAGYSARFERPPPSYHEGRPRDYNPVPGSKRPYAALDDVPPRYADTEARHSRVRVDYEIGGGSSQYGDVYSDRLGRSNVGYGSGSSRSSMSAQDSHGLYSSSSRQGMSLGGSYSGSDAGGMYSSRYGGDYVSRGSDIGGSSYSSSLYSSRSLGGSGYMGSGGSGSYY